MAKKREKESAPEPQPEAALAVTWQEIVVLMIAAKEGYDELTPGQYLHVKDHVKQLVGFGRRDFESNLCIEKFGDFWELKEKGGTLGKKNIRVYFAFDASTNEVVVLHTYKKEDDGQAPPHIMIRLRNRWRMYKKGDFTDNVIRYRRPE